MSLPSRKMHLLAGLSGLALLSTLAWASRASAADAEAAAPAARAAPADGSVEEVIVYARKRSETAIDAPLAITAMGEQQVKEQSIVSFQDLNRVAPNVILRQSNAGAGTIEAIIRGQSIAISNIGNDAPVGTYFDDVIAGQNKGAAASIFDIQSIEIARGVQGTLKGRNNTGGAISIYTHRPELDSFSGEVGATLGSRNYVQAEGILNAPIGDWAAVRVALRHITQDPQGHSTWSGQGYGGRNEWLSRVSLLVQPNDRFSWHTVYEHTLIDQDPVGRRTLPAGQTYAALIAGTLTQVNSSGLHLTPEQIIPSNFYDGSTGTGMLANDYARIDFIRSTATYNLSDTMRVKLVAGYRELKALGGADLDATPAANLESDSGGTSHQLTLEPQLSGELAGGRLNYVAGYYHYFDRGQLIADTFSYSVNPASAANPFRNHLFIREGATNTSEAAYAHVEFKATSRLELAGGLRYTMDDRRVRPFRELLNYEPGASTNALYQAGTIQAVGCSFTTPVNGVLRPAGGFVLLPSGAAVASGACPYIELEKTYNYWSYEVTARYKLADNLNIYARHGLGQKSGGFSIPIQSTVATPYNPEKVKDYEVGLKAARLLDGKLDFSVALFYSDYRDLQRFVSSLLPNGGGVASAVLNAGAATVKGVETDFSWRLSENFRLDGFLGYTDAAYDSFITHDATGAVFDLTSQPFNGAPKWTGRIAAHYERQLGSGTLEASVGWNHQSSVSLQPISFPGAVSGDVDLVDARIAWLSRDRSLELALYGTNLTDDHYFTGVTVNRAGGVSISPAAATGVYGNQGEARFVGVNLTKRFQ